MSWLTLRDDQFKFKTVGKTLLMIGESEIYPYIQKNERNQHMISWNWKHLDLD